MLNEDGTPRRNEIIFVSPTGEEIKSKRQLQQYLKSHPGGPPSSEFDWGTGILPTLRLFAKQVEICSCVELRYLNTGCMNQCIVCFLK